MTDLPGASGFAAVCMIALGSAVGRGSHGRPGAPRRPLLGPIAGGVLWARAGRRLSLRLLRLLRGGIVVVGIAAIVQLLGVTRRR